MLQYLATLLIFSSVFSFAAPQRFDFRDAIQRNSLEVSLQSPLERTTAISHFVSGWVELDPENVGAGIRGELEFDTRTFETGLESKNLFLKERVLDAGRFPLVQAAFIKVEGPVTGKATTSEGAKLRTEIGIKIKGQAKSFSLPLKITYLKESEVTRQRLPGNLLTIFSDSDVTLDRLGIQVPEGFRLMNTNSVRVILHMVGSDKLPIGTSALPDGFKPKEPPSSAPSKKVE